MKFFILLKYHFTKIKINLLSSFVLIIFILSGIATQAKSHIKCKKNIINKINADSTKESKVDYLEHIYFSGKNRDGLNKLILETIQDMEDKNATKSVAAQYTFLSNIKSDASNAKNACDIEEMIAAGIYNLDEHEADNQKIPLPSKKTESQVAPALQAASNVSYAVGETSYASYYLSNGGVGSYRSGAAGYRGGAVLGEAAGTARSINEASIIIRSLGNNKPCKNVTQKNIVIGDHILASDTKNGKTLSGKAEPVTVSITNVTFAQKKAIELNIKKIKNVANIKNSSFSNNYVTMIVISDLPVSMLSDSIMIVNKGIPFEVTSQSADEDANKQIQFSINEDAAKAPEDKKERNVSISLMGITYEQYKLVTAQLAKKDGIKSLKAGGYVASYYTAISVSTSLSADELIDDIKSILPKINLDVSSATDQTIQLVHSDKDKDQ